MVKNDGAFIQETATTMEARIEWINNHVAELREKATIPTEFTLA
jgi:hypothetical protein